MKHWTKVRFAPGVIAAVVLISAAADFDMPSAQGDAGIIADAVRSAASGAVTYAGQFDSDSTDSARTNFIYNAGNILLEQIDNTLKMAGIIKKDDMDYTAAGNGEDSSDGSEAGGGEFRPGYERNSDLLAAGNLHHDPEVATVLSMLENDPEGVVYADGVVEPEEDGNGTESENSTGTADGNDTEAEGYDTEPENAAEETEEEPAPDFYFLGVTHSTVADIQQRLMDLGFMDYAEPTEYYGSITAEAVKMFQRQNDLTQDGIIGPQTKEMLFSDDAKHYLAKLGMSGDDIKRIQRRLYEMGYLAKQEYVTGYFGDITEAAVKEMQSNNGLAADGKVGQMTFEMLYSEEAKANMLSYGDKSDVVLACQERLKTLGYLTTTPDGQYGNDTVAAVKQFQSRNDLVVDGYLGPSTMVALNSSDAVPNGLMLGDSGDTVKRVQELLARYGYMSSGSCTGYFGEVTEAAVKSFQKNNGLSVDGNVGMKTMAKLTSGEAKKASSGSSTSSGSGSSSGSSSSSGSGSTGSSSSTSSSSNSASVASLLAVAKSKVGSPYVLGAKGPNSFDCSGYVYWCLNQIGIKQSYITSYGWRTVGKYQKITSFSSIKAGDIVVVKGHVGIAAGNGMVYDASSSSGKIVYRELGAWWRNNFIVAWRIF